MQAPPYARRKDFTHDDGDQTDHAALNAELDAAANSIQGLRGNLALLQQDDGTLSADTLNTHFKADLIKQLSGNIDGKLSEAQAAASAATTAAKTAQGDEQNAKQAEAQLIQNHQYEAAARAMLASKWASQVKQRAVQLANMMRVGHA